MSPQKWIMKIVFAFSGTRSIKNSLDTLTIKIHAILRNITCIRTKLTWKTQERCIKNVFTNIKFFETKPMSVLLNIKTGSIWNFTIKLFLEENLHDKWSLSCNRKENESGHGYFNGQLPSSSQLECSHETFFFKLKLVWSCISCLSTMSGFCFIFQQTSNFSSSSLFMVFFLLVLSDKHVTFNLGIV